MTRLLALGKWIKEKHRSQAAFAQKLGVDPTRLSRWLNLSDGISAEYQAKIRKLGYQGPWPADEAAPEPEGKPVTRAEFDELTADLEDACEVIRFLLRALPEGSRPGVLPRKFRATS